MELNGFEVSAMMFRLLRVFEENLKEKTNWGRNELKTVLMESIAIVLGEEASRAREE